MTHSFTFWDGAGTATWDFADMVVGDRLVPQEINVSIRGGVKQPDLDMKIEVRDGIPQWTEVFLRSRPGGPEVRTKDLTAIRLDDWLEQIVAECSLKKSGTGWGKPVQDLSAVRDIRAARRTPRTVTPELVSAAAEIYKTHFDDRPTDAVARSFGVSYRTAARYVQHARDAGLLSKTEQGRKKV